MALVDLRDMLHHARHHGYAVGAFDLLGLEFLEGTIGAAERCRSPVVLSLAEPQFDQLDPELLMPAVEAAARRAAVPVAIQLNHGSSLGSAIRAINLGCNGVMLDASQASLTDNLRRTYEVVEMAHACGVPVEGALGRLPNARGRSAQLLPTEVDEARSYVEQTGVDFLAVSIGTVHGALKGKPELDLARLRRLGETLDIPLVVHGGSNLDEAQIRQLAAGGVAKIDYCTALLDAADSCLAQQGSGDYRLVQQAAREVIAQAVEQRLQAAGSGGRAAELLERCTPWNPVEHLIIYNVSGIGEQEVAAMMAEGRRVLSTIPGVRQVITGEAVRSDAKYRYTWLVRFCHSRVIDSYREHPAHVTFADTRFRPVAGERISIDYQVIDRPGKPA
ncbi:class II fructose-bisphosphate aldolase [Thiohalobacter sp. IOR34]|uniref:class II fructose-bisphosphate aldolase n=1 Tax=Thiohalobacter sp. IOR34 TaxID=3057176 RepID=UPI0025AEFD4A|nr:class II fructose-bisphosphate aldolase [Thiohalobacter sp. IOR34]WJW74800.1 class II fructose-bisphosphate aldolase [Thiohalobacter sp. IOR34]